MKPSAVINRLLYAAVDRIGGHDADSIARMHSYCSCRHGVTSQQSFVCGSRDPYPIRSLLSLLCR